MPPSTTSPPRGIRPRPALTARRALVEATHLFALWGFAVAQPLFQVLATDANFFVVRGSRPVDIVALALFLLLLAPAPLALASLASAAAGRRAHGLVHGGLVALLIAAVAAVPLRNGLPESVAVPLASSLALGAAGSWLYFRFPAVRQYATWLLAALAIFPAVFFFDPAIRKIVFPDSAAGSAPAAGASATPLILVVFDELPTVSLLDGEHVIDPIRYPNFAALAGAGTWYPRATASADYTEAALPALVTGNRPRKELLPIAQDHPQNLFTLLAESHDLRVMETFTRLCPPSVCEQTGESFATRFRSLLSDVGVVYLHVVLPVPMTSELPSVVQNWQGIAGSGPPSDDFLANTKDRWTADRGARFVRFVEGIESTSRPPFVFLHSSLPHAPWAYLPSGTRYPNDGEPAWGQADRWIADEVALTEVYRRHLLQVGYADRLLGKLMERLRAVNLYEEALIVVTSDHGISFDERTNRRTLSPRNVQDILSVPLILKAPFQSEGAVDDRIFEAIDLVPTLAADLDIELSEIPDGRSVRDPATPASRPLYSFRTYPGEDIETPAETLERRFQSVETKLGLFGSGADPLIPPAPAPFAALIGAEASKFTIEGESDVRVELPIPADALVVDPERRLVPARLSGTAFRAGGGRESFFLAVSVNGTVRAVTPIRVRRGNKKSVFWSTFVPEESFVAGANEIDFYLTERRRGRFRLRRAGAEYSGD